MSTAQNLYTDEILCGYPFEYWSDLSDLKEVPGVYIVYGVSPLGVCELFYVDQSKNIKDRLTDNHKEQCFKKYKNLEFYVHLEPKEDKRLKIKKEIKERYDPPCNRD